MDRTELVVAAEGETVTEARLTDPVMDGLADGEQPHHILQGQSLDIVANGEEERVFPSVDGVVSVAATDRRLTMLVPKGLERREETIAYDRIDTVETGTGRFTELRIETESASFVVNAPDEEDPAALAAFASERAVADEAAAVGGEPGKGDTGPGDLDATEVADGANAGGLGDESAGDTTDRVGSPEPAGEDAGSSADGASEADGANPLEQLEQLADLKERGVVTEEEFESRKQELLDRL